MNRKDNIKRLKALMEEMKNAPKKAAPAPKVEEKMIETEEPAKSSSKSKKAYTSKAN